MFERRFTTGALLAVFAAAAFAAEPPERDPTQPFDRTGELRFSVANTPRFALTAVVISPTRRVAVVNGKAYLTGDVVDGARIVAIEHDSVRLRDGGADVVVSLGRPRRE